MSDRTVYQFTVQRVNGEEVSLGEFRNKVLLIVNTASECGFTPQLKDMESLRKEFENSDFEILAFPSNDFGKQEPLEGTALTKFCKINFHTNFKVFDKVHVRGKEIHPLFKFLSDKKYNGKLTSCPRWNFHKYLINRDGEVVDFFYSFTRPDSLKVKKRIQQLLEPAPVFV
jgi:glutathione peroxidase